MYGLGHWLLCTYILIVGIPLALCEYKRKFKKIPAVDRTQIHDLKRCCQIHTFRATSIYIFMFQHSAMALFDLWLFLLRWRHTPQAFLEKSLTKPASFAEENRTTGHRGLPYSFRIVYGFFNVPQGTYEHISEKTWKSKHLQMKLQRQRFLLRAVFKRVS